MTAPNKIDVIFYVGKGSLPSQIRFYYFVNGSFVK